MIDPSQRAGLFARPHRDASPLTRARTAGAAFGADLARRAVAAADDAAVFVPAIARDLGRRMDFLAVKAAPILSDELACRLIRDTAGRIAWLVAARCAYQRALDAHLQGMLDEWHALAVVGQSRRARLRVAMPLLIAGAMYPGAPAGLPAVLDSWREAFVEMAAMLDRIEARAA